jgi:hypothetical protein
VGYGTGLRHDEVALVEALCEVGITGRSADPAELPRPIVLQGVDGESIADGVVQGALVRVEGVGLGALVEDLDLVVRGADDARPG